MSKDIPLYRAFDWEFSMDYAWHKKWFRKQWRTIKVDPYWKARNTFGGCLTCMMGMIHAPTTNSGTIL